MTNAFYLNNYFDVNSIFSKKTLICITVLVGVVATSILSTYVVFGNDGTISSLKAVVVVCRHGERKPISLIQSEHINLEKYWPTGLEQLTITGIQQMYKLGQILRDRYKSFIPKYESKSVRVDSSDFDRTLMSAEALLASWFPPEDEQIWNNDLNWQPIPVHTTPIENDKLILMTAPCPRYIIEKDKVTVELKKNETAEEKETIEYLRKHTGSNITTLKDIEMWYTCLYLEATQGHELPSWKAKIYPQPITDMAKKAMAIRAWNTVLQRLHGGYFLNVLLKEFKMRVESKNKLKLHIYSGHDQTLVTIWRTFGFEELLLPSPGSSLIWELHHFNDSHFVKMFYLNDTSQTGPYELEIPNCSQPCSMKKLVKITKDVRLYDWEKECDLNYKAEP